MSVLGPCFALAGLLDLQAVPWLRPYWLGRLHLPYHRILDICCSVEARLVCVQVDRCTCNLSPSSHLKNRSILIQKTLACRHTNLTSTLNIYIHYCEFVTENPGFATGHGGFTTRVIF